MPKDKKWDSEKQKNAEALQRGVNKPAAEVLKESWNNLKSAFSGNVRANTLKKNEKRKRGGDAGY